MNIKKYLRSVKHWMIDSKPYRWVTESEWYNKIFRKPYMSAEEIDWIKNYLKDKSDTEALRIFEYGAGGSTIYFSLFLQEQGIGFRWDSVEHHRGWAESMNRIISNLNLPGVKVHYQRIPGVEEFKLNDANYRRKLLSENSSINYKAYTNFSRKIGGKFDLVLVDGRNRKNCVNTGIDLIKDDGAVLLHDAQRSYYQCLTEKYPGGEFVTDNLWVYKNSLSDG